VGEYTLLLLLTYWIMGRKPVVVTVKKFSHKLVRIQVLHVSAFFSFKNM